MKGEIEKWNKLGERVWGMIWKYNAYNPPPMQIVWQMCGKVKETIKRKLQNEQTKDLHRDA